MAYSTDKSAALHANGHTTVRRATLSRYDGRYMATAAAIYPLVSTPRWKYK